MFTVEGIAGALGLFVAGIACAATAAEGPAAGRIPVILDTDIGGDIDDTWALALLLKCPELDLKMVVTDTGDTVYRAKIAAKLLEVAKRTDVQVAIGIKQKGHGKPQGPWVADYDLAKYPGKVHDDGVAALVEAIMTAPQPLTLICIGPVPNIKAALAKQPEIAKKARFVGMHGSIRKGYNGGPKPQPEYNVKQDAKACQAAFTAAWPMVITPLDTCGIVRLRGDKYRKVAESDDPIAKAVIENYRIWWKAHNPNKPEKIDASSVLFDTVAVYLTFSTDLLNMERLNIVVTDDGFTREDPKGKAMDCAMSWKDLGKFEDLLVARLAGKP